MASEQSLQAWKAASTALQTLQREIAPVLVLASSSNPHNDEKNESSSIHAFSGRRQRQRAVAQTVVALTLGTLRFIKPRLLLLPNNNSSSSIGSSSSTRTAAAAATETSQQQQHQTLREDLNRMRQLLVTLQEKKKKPEKSDQDNVKPRDDESITNPSSLSDNDTKETRTQEPDKATQTATTVGDAVDGTNSNITLNSSSNTTNKRQRTSTASSVPSNSISKNSKTSAKKRRRKHA